MEKVASLDKNDSYGPVLQKMLSAFPLAYEKRNGWYTHDDNPRFDFRVLENGSIQIHSWTGRTEDQILAMGGLKRSDIRLKGTYPGPTKDSLDLLDLAVAKRIHPHFLENLGLQSGYRYYGRNYVKIPYYNIDGTQHTKIKIRKAIDGEYKHCWDIDTPGEIIPYGLHKLSMAHEVGYLIIGEGESDGWTCWYHNFPYLGVPGVGHEKCLNMVDVALLPPKIYIIHEPDQAKKLLINGEGFYKNVHKVLRSMDYHGEIFCVDFEKLAGSGDPSSLHVKLWDYDHKATQFRDIMAHALSCATPANDMQDVKPSDFSIKHEGVLQSIISRDKQALYALAPEIAEMEEIEQDRIRLAAYDVWGKDFPMREFSGLLRSASYENEKSRQPRPNIISAAELMKRQFAPVDFVVPDILPTGLIVFGGKQKIGKSWFDLNLSLAVASGGIALGQHQVKQGDVLYMALEDTERRLQDRIGQLMAPGAEVPECLDLVTSWPRMDVDGIAALEQWIVSRPNARLIIIDPWVKVKPRVRNRHGETGYDADYEALEGIKKLADSYNICILIQFHLRKSSAEDPFDEVNATTGVTACADGFISLKRPRGETEATLYASGRDYKDEVNLALSFNNGMWKILGEGSSSIYYTLSKERREVIDILCGALQPMSPKDLAVLLAVSDNTMRKRLFDMKEDDQIEWVEDDRGNGYISLIPSPKQNNNANLGNGGNGGNDGNEGNSGNVTSTSSSVTDRYRDEEHLVTPLQPVIEPSEEDGVTTVTTVTDNTDFDNSPIPLSLIQEYRDLYKQLQQVPPEELAPLGTVHWYVPDSGLPTGLVSAREYFIRLQALGKSKDLCKLVAGRDEMLRKLRG